MADKRTNPSVQEAISGAGEDDSGFGSNDPTAGQPTSSSTGLETGTPGAKGFVDASRGVSIATQVDNYPEPKEDEEVEVKTTVKTNSGRTPAAGATLTTAHKPVNNLNRDREWLR